MNERRERAQQRQRTTCRPWADHRPTHVIRPPRSAYRGTPSIYRGTPSIYLSTPSINRVMSSV